MASHLLAANTFTETTDMKRTMYVIQRNDGAFYWKHQSISSFNGFDMDFSKAALYKTEKQAQNIADAPCYKGKCRVRKVTIILEGQ